MKSLATDLSCFQHLYTSIADEMGASLARTAFSANIKERKDFSCALFDDRGRLLAQAAHIPVHLGAMPRSVEAALQAFPQLEAGDVVMLNDPFAGGTHLPDITLVSPVMASGGSAAFYVATRAHHADVGGITPGSLPVSTSIHQEGLRIPPVRLVRKGLIQEDLLRLVCANSRTPEERRGDLRAQINAHHTGERRLQAQLERHGMDRLREINGELIAYADRLMRAELSSLPTGCWQAEDVLEGEETDTRLRVCLTVDATGVKVDLTGSDDAMTGSLNAVRAITESAVYYVFLCLLCTPRGDGHSHVPPVNAGSFDSIHIQTRPGSVLDAQWPAAVAGGNVETSQRVVDVVMRALAQAVPDRMPAQGQGTMNNVTMGGLREDGSSFAYYETLGGGMGATRGIAGEDAIQVHMTNTLNTPVEALEFAFPFRINRYAIRDDSGGAGTWPGGNGLIREWAFTTPTELTLLTERRRHAPNGIGTGGDGQPGTQCLLRHGQVIPLPAKGTFHAQPGDILRVETPGGGGAG